MGHKDNYEEVKPKVVRGKLTNGSWVTITSWNLQKTHFFCIEERPGLPTISAYLPKAYLMYTKEQ